MQNFKSLARWLVKESGVGQDLETMAYVSLNDIRYNVFMLAANKAINQSQGLQ